MTALKIYNQFRLRSSVEPIVKLEGKSVSLPEVERCLANHDWIAQSVALIVTRDRDRLSALIALTPLGHQHYDEVGPNAFARSLRESLSKWLEPEAIPRDWRFADTIPLNALGKVQLDLVEKLFEPRAIALFPEVLTDHETSHRRILTLRVDADCPYFQGHFPGHPVLPGVVQVGWAAHFAQKHIGFKLSFKSIRLLKFKRLIRPNIDLRLVLDFDTARSSLSFNYSSKLGDHSQGRLGYEVEV